MNAHRKEFPLTGKNVGLNLVYEYLPEKTELEDLVSCGCLTNSSGFVVVHQYSCKQNCAGGTHQSKALGGGHSKKGKPGEIYQQPF